MKQGQTLKAWRAKSKGYTGAKAKLNETMARAKVKLKQVKQRVKVKNQKGKTKSMQNKKAHKLRIQNSA